MDLYKRVDEPKTWTDVPGERFVHYDPVTFKEIQTYLLEFGWVAVPFTPTKEILEELTNGDTKKNTVMKLRYMKALRVVQMEKEDE